MSKKVAFTIRLVVWTVVIFALWSLIAKMYAQLTTDIVKSWIWNIGYYIEGAQKAENSLLSPVIPFLILMIATWGREFIVIDKKINLRIILWTLGISLLLFAFTIYGQFLINYISLPSVQATSLRINVISFLVSTGPFLIWIVSWFVLSRDKLTEIFYS
ncbi:MAG TPA: hypothetical protein PKV16_02660 [Caldisericia bacterium]|nr:hypothetical protein [Caldisericia bacterium]HPF48215.1 hypothetical protein [Caldisericia bacterium]HPI83849.1 hypothetical protein [Caldisericia bacterium]HPQ92668.1 hypothetical protein [Caldisericia bacterium]HRV74234.1 hypothetical protein [Caldisericia bacterium]